MTQHNDAPPLLTRRERLESEKNNPEITPMLVSKRTAASALGLCVRTIDNLIASKQLGCRRIGRRTLIPYRELVAFARRDHIGAPESRCE